MSSERRMTVGKEAKRPPEGGRFLAREAAMVSAMGLTPFSARIDLHPGQLLKSRPFLGICPDPTESAAALAPGVPPAANEPEAQHRHEYPDDPAEGALAGQS